MFYSLYMHPRCAVSSLRVHFLSVFDFSSFSACIPHDDYGCDSSIVNNVGHISICLFVFHILYQVSKLGFFSILKWRLNLLL